MICKYTLECSFSVFAKAEKIFSSCNDATVNESTKDLFRTSCRRGLHGCFRVRVGHHSEFELYSAENTSIKYHRYGKCLQTHQKQSWNQFNSDSPFMVKISTVSPLIMSTPLTFDKKNPKDTSNNVRTQKKGLKKGRTCENAFEKVSSTWNKFQ